MGFYKRKILRKHTFDQGIKQVLRSFFPSFKNPNENFKRKHANDNRKKKRNLDLDHAIDQEKASFKTLIFFF